MSSYRNLNDFLCAFINHSLANYDYVIRDRLLMEKLFDYDSQIMAPAVQAGTRQLISESIFFVGKSNGAI